MDMTMEITGLKELNDSLLKLESNVAKKIVRKAVREGTKVINKVAKQNLRSMVGGEMGNLIAKHYKINSPKQRKGSYFLRNWVDPKANDLFVHINVSDGTRHYIPNAIEFGHGNAAPIPAIRNAYDSQKENARNVLKKELLAGIERESNRKVKTR